MKMAIDRLSQGQVHNEREENEKLEMSTRMAHVESEVVTIRTLFIEDFERRKEDRDKAKKRDLYLDKLMKKEEEDAEIRMAVKKKLLSNGVWFGFLALCGGLWWLFLETVKRHT